MSFIFSGEAGAGLRIKYFDKTPSQINGTTSISDALMLCKVEQPLKIALFDNGFDVDLGIAFVHPSKDPDVAANRLKAFELPALRPLNFDISGSTGLTFDVGMWIYVWKLTGAAGSGKLRVIAWS